MESAIIGVGTSICIILTLGFAAISRRLRELSLTLQDHKKAVLTGSLGVCRRIKDKDINKIPDILQTAINELKEVCKNS